MFFTSKKLAVGWSFMHLIVPCWNIFNTNSVDANFHAFNPPIYWSACALHVSFILSKLRRMFLSFCRNLQHKRDCWFQSKCPFTLKFTHVSLLRRRIPCVFFMKIRVQYNPSDITCGIHKLRLNIWFMSNRRLDREWHFVGFLITLFRTAPSRDRSSQFTWWDSKIHAKV